MEEVTVDSLKEEIEALKKEYLTNEKINSGIIQEIRIRKKYINYLVSNGEPQQLK